MQRGKLPPSLRTEREDQENSLLGIEDIQSSTRVDSMALLGTKARDKYYRNDSPVEVVSHLEFHLNFLFTVTAVIGKKSLQSHS
jgi:hypothetical protein